MIIFANVLLDRGVITPDAFTALLLMALGSTVLTMPVVRRALRAEPALSAVEARHAPRREGGVPLGGQAVQD